MGSNLNPAEDLIGGGDVVDSSGLVIRDEMDKIGHKEELPTTSASESGHKELRTPFVIGVAGGASSGKTSVCNLIMEQLHDQDIVLINQWSMQPISPAATDADKRDWSSLFPELLNLIAKCLEDISDFIRFRSVCKDWRSSTPVTDIKPQFPWIHENYIESTDKTIRFYSMQFQRFYNIPVPKSVNEVYELSEGYLLAGLCDNNLHTNQPFLLNPLNSDKIQLPQCIYNCHWFASRQNEISKYGICCLRRRACRRCCKRQSHRKLEDKLFFSRVGQETWQRLGLECDHVKKEHYHFHESIFTFEKYTGYTVVTDVATSMVSYTVPPVKGYSRIKFSHLLEASGNIFGVFGSSKEETVCYEVFLLVNKGCTPHWARVKSIGEYALFVDKGGGFIMKADELAGIRANALHYLNCVYVAASKSNAIQMVRVDIKTGIEDYKLCPSNFKEAWWFVPKLCHLQAQ